MDQKSTQDPKEFYNDVMPKKFGKDYEYTRWHKTPIAEAGYQMTRRAILGFFDTDPEFRPVRVLELGPGAGTWTEFLLKQYPDAQFTLLDISREMLDRVKERVKEQGDVSYVESDVLEFDDPQQYDLFFSSRVLEYIPSKRAFAQKVAELLTHGGRGFVITKMPHYSRDEMLGRKAARFHTGQITPEALSGMFLASGLEVEGVFPVTISIPLLHSAFINRLAGRYFCSRPLNMVSAFFAESYCVILRKP